MKSPGSVFVQVASRKYGDLIAGEWVSPAEAINRLHEAIRLVRELSAPTFDPSFGEGHPSLLVPNDAELAELVRRNSAVPH
jgi:hypothetical protein